LEENKTPSATPAPFEAVVVILSAFFFSFLIPSLLIFVFPGEKEGTFSPLGIKIALALGELCLGMVPLLYLWKRGLSLRDIFRWRRTPPKILWLSVPLGLGLTILLDEIDRLIQQFIPMPEEWMTEMVNIMKVTSGLELLLVILSAVVLASVMEEAVFRGFLQKSMEEHINVTQAVIYTSLGWAIIHLNPYIAAQIFLFGFVLGYLAWRANSIFPAIICHAINNGVALLYFNIDFSKELPYYEWKGHVSPLLLLLSAVVVFAAVQYLDRYYRSLTPPDSNNISPE